MRVLVTGGAGFIGSHTVDYLLSRGYTVRVLDALRPPVHGVGEVPPYVPKNVDFVIGDVRDRTSWERALRGVDAVFHLAAYQDYLPDFSSFIQTNTLSTALLYEVILAGRLPIRRIVVASSQAVYGEGVYRCEGQCSVTSQGTRDEVIRFPRLREERQLREGQWEPRCPVCRSNMIPLACQEDVAGPHNAYAISKYGQELIALNLGRRYGLPTVCLRYSIVQGARQSFRNAYSGVLRVFSQRLLNGRPPICYEDGRQLRDYVSVHDVVSANAIALEDDRAIFEVYNVGGSRVLTVLEYALLVAARCGRHLPPTVPGVYRVGDVRHVFSDTSKLRELGWSPRITLEEIVDEYLAWAPSQPGFADYSEEAEARMYAVGAIQSVAPTAGASDTWPSQGSIT